MPQIAIVGSGFGGLGLGIQLKKHGIDTFSIFEKADSVGGTWRANTYPGAECDIPSALYSYSFENFDWPNKWSHQPVIREYLEHCAEHYRLRPHLHFGATVTSCVWNEDEQVWAVTVDHGDDGVRTYRFDMVVSATGQLSRPRWPDIEGIDSFAGDMFHSAEWDHDVDLAGKKVASIGAGASAVQYVPQVAKTADTTVFARSANWIIPKNDRDYTGFEKALIRRSRFARNLRRFGLWFRSDVVGFNLMRRTSRLRPLITKYSTKYLHDEVSDPDKRAALTPDYPLGAKRVLFSDDFYQAIEAHDVGIVRDRIARIDETGIVTVDDDGTATHRDFDVIVIGTGFHAQDFLTPMKIVGRDGRNLHDEWSVDAGGPQAHLGLTVHGYPNLFFMYGPNTNLGHTSIILMLESQARYILSTIEQMGARALQAVEVTAQAQQRFTDELDERLAERAWVLIDDSWYLQAGRVTNNWVGRTTEYRRRTKHADLDEYTVTPKTTTLPPKA